jgi:glutathione S-transferase
MQMDMGIRPMKVRESYIHVQDALNFVKEHTRETGYIVGDHFTLADLSAAVGLFAVCLPPEYPVDFPRPLPKEIQAWLNRWERHPGTKWVRRMYNRYRLPGALGD